MQGTEIALWGIKERKEQLIYKSHNHLHLMVSTGFVCEVDIYSLSHYSVVRHARKDHRNRQMMPGKAED